MAENISSASAPFSLPRHGDGYRALSGWLLFQFRLLWRREDKRETCRGSTGRSRTAAIFAPYLSSDNNWISFIYSITDLGNTWATWFIWGCCSLSDLLGLANSSEGRRVKALGSIIEISCTGQCHALPYKRNILFCCIFLCCKTHL